MMHAGSASRPCSAWAWPPRSCAAVVGCGGQATEIERRRRRARARPRTPPTPARPAGGSPDRRGTRPPRQPPAAADAAAPVKAEGLGHAQGPGRLRRRRRRPPRCSPRRARPPRIPRSAPRTRPIVSERLVVDAATKGVKNVLVYLPKPTAVNDEAKKAAGKAEGRLRPEEVRLRAARPGRHDRRARSRSSRATRSTTTSTPSSRTTPFNNAARRPARTIAFTPTSRRADARRGHLRYSSLDEGLLDGPRQPLLRRDRRQGELRDQERPGRHPEGRRLAGGRPTASSPPPSGDEVDDQGQRRHGQDLHDRPGKVKPAK